MKKRPFEIVTESAYGEWYVSLVELNYGMIKGEYCSSAKSARRSFDRLARRLGFKNYVHVKEIKYWKK